MMKLMLKLPQHSVTLAGELCRQQITFDLSRFLQVIPCSAMGDRVNGFVYALTGIEDQTE